MEINRVLLCAQILVLICVFFSCVEGKKVSSQTAPHISGISVNVDEQFGNTLNRIQDNRPPANQRRFVSKVIDEEIETITSKMKDKELASIFANCLPNTLDTTVYYKNDGNDIHDTFVITGDIYAMWFRDSTNQVLPYVPYVSKDKHLENMIKGLIYRQTELVLYDPYANAFNYGSDQISPFMQTDTTVKYGFLNTQVPAMTTVIHERKYELDSLSAVMKLSYEYYKATNNSAFFANNPNWAKAMATIMEVIVGMQVGSEVTYGGFQGYFFQRQTSTPTDSLMWGIGAPGRTTGMSRSPFRPSDDACTFPYPIAANAMTVVSLRQVSTILAKIGQTKLSSDALALAAQIDAGIKNYGTAIHPVFGKIYGYEVDGYGSAIFMDDAGIPGLLSLPLLGYCKNSDPLYQATRKFILSEHNPYYSKGSAGEGVGGPHVGLGRIWPMAIIVRAMTTDNDTEIMEQLAMLKSSTAGTGFMHESFWKDDVNNFSRPWFAWVNSLFGQFILKLAKEKPNLIF